MEAGLAVLTGDRDCARAAGLDATPRVLAIDTEGVTAPSVYARCVGEPVDAVATRRHLWLRRTVFVV